jgi:hypothetical protein
VFCVPLTIAVATTCRKQARKLALGGIRKSKLCCIDGTVLHIYIYKEHNAEGC